MKSKKSFQDVQPWRVQVRFKESLQDSFLIALGSTFDHAEKHVRNANPLLSVDLTDVPMIHGIDGSKVTLTDLKLVSQF